jgi:hypothetical protein
MKKNTVANFRMSRMRDCWFRVLVFTLVLRSRGSAYALIAEDGHANAARSSEGKKESLR